MYSNSEIYLMDDPLSALDANVKKSIFEKVMLDELKGRTRILVTHAIDFLHLVDDIIVMDGGRVLLQGTFEEIREHEYMQKLMNAHENNKGSASRQKESSPVKVKEVQFDSEMVMNPKNESMERTFEEVLNQTGAKIISDEDDEIIEVGFATYVRYFMGYYGGWTFIVLS